MSMRVLVTGSAGHLGEALVRTLRDLKNEVIGLDILASPFTTNVGSITDRAFVERCMNGVQTVFHAAALHKPHIATHSRQDFFAFQCAAGVAAAYSRLRDRICPSCLENVSKHRPGLRQCTSSE
jgi:nucleoside-diphosphate-sugar epimerase